MSTFALQKGFETEIPIEILSALFRPFDFPDPYDDKASAKRAL
jgi:hypothetical protein